MATQLLLHPDTIDQRRGARSVTVFALGKLTVRGVEHPCFIRDRSDGGVRVETDARLAPDEMVEIEMRGLTPTAASVRWVRDGFAGLEFRPTPEQRALADPLFVPRGPRFALDLPAIFRTDHSRFDVEARDVAIGGMKLKTGLALASGVLGSVELPGGSPMPCVVCWSRARYTGVRFITRLPMEQLFRILGPR